MTPEEFFRQYGHFESAIMSNEALPYLRDQLIRAAWTCLREIVEENKKTDKLITDLEYKRLYYTSRRDFYLQLCIQTKEEANRLKKQIQELEAILTKNNIPFTSAQL